MEATYKRFELTAEQASELMEMLLPNAGPAGSLNQGWRDAGKAGGFIWTTVRKLEWIWSGGARGSLIGAEFEAVAEAAHVPADDDGHEPVTIHPNEIERFLAAAVRNVNSDVRRALAEIAQAAMRTARPEASTDGAQRTAEVPVLALCDAIDCLRFSERIHREAAERAQRTLTGETGDETRSVHDEVPGQMTPAGWAARAAVQMVAALGCEPWQMRTKAKHMTDKDSTTASFDAR